MGYRPRPIVAFVLALLVAAVVASVSAVKAAASTDVPSSKGGITLDAPKTVAVVVSPLCTSNGEPQQCVIIPFSVTNTTGSAATCTVIVINQQGTAAAPPVTSTVAPGSTSEGSFNFFYQGERKVGLNLKCDGQLIQSQKRSVTIIP
jgi:hypothetical protein